MESTASSCLYENSLVLSATDAAHLITKREHLGKLILSLKGTITALSDVIKVGKYQTCLIEVDQCIILVLKDFHLEWHSELEPGSEYVFYSLRLTTLEKGVSKPCSVFFVLSTSLFSRLTDGNSVTSVSLQEWLKQKCMDISLIGETLRHEVDCEENQELVNYEGTVTSTEMASSGIVVLDNKLRLVSLLINVKPIKKHSRVVVYNVHFLQDGNWLYLVCCMRSCIRIHEPDSSNGDAADSSTSTGDVKDSIDNRVHIFIQDFIKKYGLNLREITALLQLHNTMIRQGRSRSYQEKVFVCFLKSCVSAVLIKSPVKSTDAFIYHHQLCPLNRSQSDGCRIPQVVNIRLLKEETVKAQSSLDSDNGYLAESGIKFESSTHHLKLCSSYGKVLVGQILACPEGIIFKDDTGQLCVILLSESDAAQSGKQSDGHVSGGCPEHVTKDSDTDNPLQSHFCCQCCFRRSQPVTQLTCPILNPWIIGKNICVRKFTTIIESYHNASSLDVINSGDMTCDKMCLYLAFCLLDCVLMDEGENSPPMSVGSIPSSSINNGSAANPSVSGGSFSSSLSSCNLHSNLSGQENMREVMKCDNEFICYVYITEKQPLTYTDNRFKKRHICQFRTLGHIIDLDLEKWKIMEESKSFDATSKRFKVCHPENAASKKETSFFTDSSKKDTTEQKSKSICASFSDRSSKLYSCINIGHLYKFTSKTNSSTDPFKPNFSQVQLQRVAEKSKVRITIEMPEDVLVESLPLALCEQMSGFEDVHVMHSVSQVLSERCSETVVSFQGVIIKREFATSFASREDRNDIKSLAMTNIKLEVVQDTHDANINSSGITIYLDAPKTVYTLGLVPGAVVKFHRVERKVSKAGNIYCRFIAISVAEVVKFDTLRDPNSLTQNVALKDLPKELLINIWKSDLEEFQIKRQTFRIHCHIEKIFKLSIKSVCSSCRSLYLKQGCQSRRCGNLSYSVPVANAVLLVEDGTCPATVKVWGSSLVCRLLTLTSNQWEDLIAVVLEHGEVLIDATSSPLLSIAKFLRSLIGSSMILRPCKMDVRVYKGLFSTLKKMPLEGYQENSVKIGKHYMKTLSLPRMHLECLMISERV